MSRELWEKVTDGIGEKYINEASECFQKHNRPIASGDEDMAEQAIPIEIKPSEKKNGIWKTVLAVAGAAAAVVLCVIGGQYLFNGSSPIDPITSTPSGTEETSETVDSAESTEQIDVFTPSNELEQNIALVPPYNNEHYIFDIPNLPFAASIGLPEGWYIEDLSIYDDKGEYVACISYDAYDIYPEALGQPNYYRAVYNQIMLGSVVNYDIDYTPVVNGAYYSNATTKCAVRDLETNEVTYTQAILAYNDNVGSYIIIDFPEDIDETLLSDIAGSIQLARDKIGTSKHLASAFSEAWEESEQSELQPKMYAMETSVVANHSLITVFVPTLDSYCAYLYVLDGGLLQGVEVLPDTDMTEVYYGENGFLIHTVSEYDLGTEIKYQDRYFTYNDYALSAISSAYRTEKDGEITFISSNMTYEEYIAWKIEQTADYYYIRSAQFPQNDDKFVPISDDMEAMAEHFLSALEDMPPNGGTYDEKDNIEKEEKDLTTLYTMIAQRFLAKEFIPDRAGVFVSPMDNAEMVGLYYEQNGAQCCQLYYIRDNEMYFIGTFTDLITLELIGDELITSGYTSLLEARYITDSYVRFEKFGDIYIGEEYDKAQRLLDENGNVTMYFDCETNAEVKVTQQAYEHERSVRREQAGEYHFGIDLSAPYETVTITNDISALVEQISATAQNNTMNPGLTAEPLFSHNGTEYYIDLTIGTGIVVMDANGKILWCTSNPTYFNYADSLSELTPLDTELNDVSLYLMPDGMIAGISPLTSDDSFFTSDMWNERLSAFCKESELYNLSFYQPLDKLSTIFPEEDFALPAMRYNNDIYFIDPTIPIGDCAVNNSDGTLVRPLEFDVLDKPITDIDDLTYIGIFNFINEKGDLQDAKVYDIGNDRLLALYFDGKNLPDDPRHAYMAAICCRKNEWWNDGKNLPEPPQLTVTINGETYPISTGSYTWKSIKYGTMHSDGDINTALAVPYSTNGIHLNIPDDGNVTTIDIPWTELGQTYSYDQITNTLYINNIKDFTCTITVEYPQGACEYYFYIDSYYITNVREIDEIYTDYFVGKHTIYDTHKVYYVNISNDSEWDGYEYTKGEYFDIVTTNNSTERRLYLLDFGTASILPVGTKLYEDEYIGDVILAEINGELIPYYMIVEE